MCDQMHFIFKFAELILLPRLDGDDVAVFHSGQV